MKSLVDSELVIGWFALAGVGIDARSAQRGPKTQAYEFLTRGIHEHQRCSSRPHFTFSLEIAVKPDRRAVCNRTGELDDGPGKRAVRKRHLVRKTRSTRQASNFEFGLTRRRFLFGSPGSFFMTTTITITTIEGQ